MRNELLMELTCMLNEYVDQDQLQDAKMRMTIILDNYEISKRETDVIVWDENKNQDILKKFLAAKIAAGLSQRTIYYYKNSLTGILAKIGKSYDEISADDIRLYLALRTMRDKVSSVTARNEQRCLSAFYGWLQKEDIWLRNPMLKVEPIKEHKEKKKAYDLMDLEKIRNACRTKREKAMIEVMASTWCRVSEITNIRLDEIAGEKIIVHGKGNKDREVYLNARALLAVQDYLHERKDLNPYLFPKAKNAGNIQAYSMNGKRGNSNWYTQPDLVDDTDHMDKSSMESIIRTIGKRAGVPRCHPHRFRRTGATLALRSGMPLLVVSKMLGHRSVETTQIYLDISDDELHEAHKKYVI